MARRFYSSKKRARQHSSFEEFSRQIERLSPGAKIAVCVGVFVFCLFWGVLLATILNTSTVKFLARLGKLPLIYHD